MAKIKRQISNISNASVAQMGSSIRRASAASIASLRRASVVSIQSVRNFFTGKSSRTFEEDDLAYQIHEVKDRIVDMMMEDITFYDRKDMVRIQEDEWFINRYIMDKKDVDAAVHALKSTLFWRHKNGINQDSDDAIPWEGSKLGATGRFRDTNGVPVAVVQLKYFNPKILNDWGNLAFSVIFLSVEKLEQDAKTTGRKWGFIIDYTGAGMSNFDITLFSNVISSIFSHYPMGIEYVWLYEPSWYLKPIINTFILVVPSKFRSITKIMNQKSVQEILGPACPKIFGGKATLDRMISPKAIKIADFAQKKGYSEEQVKRFMAYFESNQKMLKKDEQ